MVEEALSGLLAGGVNELKKPLGLPSAVSSSMGGVLTRTASWRLGQQSRSRVGMEDMICTYITRKLTDGSSETVLEKDRHSQFD